MNFVNSTIKNICQDESGQGTLEFASSIVILMAMTFGMIDFGRIVYVNSTIQAAGQEAARAAIVQKNAVDAAHYRMIGLDTEQAEVIVVKGVDNYVEVIVSYEFSFVTPLVGSLFGGQQGTVELTSSASMVN